MKTDNEILAEFMGAKLDRATSGGQRLWSIVDLPEFCKQVKVPESRLRVFYSKDLEFDTSWDWLHPVLEKIEEQLDELKEESGIVPIFEDEYSHPWEMPMTTRIVDAHAAAVNLIKFLNANQQKS